MKRLRPWKSRHETLTDNKRSLDFYAAMSGEPQHEFHTRIPPPPKKREKKDGGEATVNDRIRAWLKGKASIVLYRNNRGVIPLENGGRLTYGVGPNGASDWIGYKIVTVTPGMVGRKVAVFTAVEAKRPGEKARPDQLEFMTGIVRDGGISGVASSEDDLDSILGG